MLHYLVLLPAVAFYDACVCASEIQLCVRVVAYTSLVSCYICCVPEPAFGFTYVVLVNIGPVLGVI